MSIIRYCIEIEVEVETEVSELGKMSEHEIKGEMFDSLSTIKSAGLWALDTDGKQLFDVIDIKDEFKLFSESEKA